MAKLTPKQVKRLSDIGIKATDDKLAKEKLIEFLEKNDIEGVEDYEIDQLIEMAEVFYEPSDAPEEVEEDEEDEVEEVDDEEDDTVEEDDDEEEDDTDQFDDMDRTELKQFIAKNKLEVVVKKSMEDDDIRNLIREAMDEEEVEEIEEEDDEEEVEEAPAKKPVKPAATSKKPAKVEEDEEDLLDEVVEEVKSKNINTKQQKPAAKAEVKKENKNGAGRKTELAGEKWNGRENKEHLKMKDVFIKKFFPEDEFQIDILKQGFTIRALGNNAKTTVFNYDELRIVDGELVGNLYCNRFKSVDDLCEFLQEEFQEPDKVVGMFRGESHPCIRKMSQSEVFEVFSSDVMKEALKRSNVTDVKMGQNREKLEETLKSKKTTAKK
jgi:hypothetical protein